MFRTIRISLYRRFLMLAVLLACLYALPVSNKVAANACCDACDSFYNSCTTNCILYVKEDDQPACLATCETNYQDCGLLCPGPPMGCSHP